MKLESKMAVLKPDSKLFLKFIFGCYVLLLLSFPLLRIIYLRLPKQRVFNHKDLLDQMRF